MRVVIPDAACSPEQLVDRFWWFTRAYWRQWAKRRPRLAVEFESAANYRLFRAATDFDAAKRSGFMPYLKRCLYGEMHQVIRSSRPLGYQRMHVKCTWPETDTIDPYDPDHDPSSLDGEDDYGELVDELAALVPDDLTRRAFRSWHLAMPRHRNLVARRAGLTQKQFQLAIAEAHEAIRQRCPGGFDL